MDISSNTSPRNRSGLPLPPWALVLGAVAVPVLVIGLVLFFVNNGVTNQGNKYEASLNQQYENNINYLSDCVVRIRETAGVAEAQADQFNEIITSAIEGRYDEGSSAQVGGGALFSAIQEAYPNLDNLGNTYQQVLSTVNGCRTDYRDQQSNLMARFEEYDRWRTGSFTARTFGGEFPSDNLRARKGDVTLRGQDAYNHMTRVVVVATADNAYETGTLEAEDPFGNNDE